MLILGLGGSSGQRTVRTQCAQFWDWEVAAAGEGSQNLEMTTNACFSVVGTVEVTQQPKNSQNPKKGRGQAAGRTWWGCW